MRGFMKIAVQHARQLMERDNFDPTASALAAHAEFGQTVDSVRHFADAYERDPAARVDGGVAYDWYKHLCLLHDIKGVLGRNKFYDRLSGLKGITRIVGAHNAL